MMPKGKAKQCVVLEYTGTNPTTYTVVAEVKDTTAARAWLRDHGQSEKTYRIGFIRPEGYTIEMPEPKRKLQEWGE
jgi:hypothetical protein